MKAILKPGSTQRILHFHKIVSNQMILIKLTGNK